MLPIRGLTVTSAAKPKDDTTSDDDKKKASRAPFLAVSGSCVDWVRAEPPRAHSEDCTNRGGSEDRSSEVVEIQGETNNAAERFPVDVWVPNFVVVNHSIEIKVVGGCNRAPVDFR